MIVTVIVSPVIPQLHPPKPLGLGAGMLNVKLNGLQEQVSDDLNPLMSLQPEFRYFTWSLYAVQSLVPSCSHLNAISAVTASGQLKSSCPAADQIDADGQGVGGEYPLHNKVMFLSIVDPTKWAFTEGFVAQLSPQQQASQQHAVSIASLLLRNRSLLL